MVRVVEFHSGKAAPIDVEVNISLVEIRRDGLPRLRISVQLLYLLPDFSTRPARLKPVLHIQKVQSVVLRDFVYNYNYPTNNLIAFHSHISNGAFLTERRIDILFGQHLLIQIRIFESGSLLKSFLQISLEQRNILRF